MPVGLTTTAKNVMLNALKGTNPTAQIAYISLHNGDPGTAGTTGELTGGSPAYARKAVTWTDSTASDLTISGSLVFDVPASSTVSWFGLWTAVTAGTFMGAGQLSASETFSAQGTYTLTDADVTL